MNSRYSSTYVCKECNSSELSEDDVYQCAGCDEYFCDGCHQSTGRYLTEEESGEFYDEDDPEWYCSSCTETD